MSIYWRRNAAACDLVIAEIFRHFLFQKGKKSNMRKNAENLKVKGNFFQAISVAVTVTFLKK